MPRGARHDPAPDRARVGMTDLAARLKRHGYRALEVDRRQHGGAPCHATRMLGRRAVVVAGADGARLFYDEDVVEREGAIPPPLARLLFGKGAVHGLDGEQHRRRKGMFLGMLGPEQVAGCARSAHRRLSDRLAQMGEGAEVRVHDVLVAVYGGAVLEWAGVEVDEQQAERVSRSLARVVDGFGFAGTAYPRAWQARKSTDRWFRQRIGAVRSGRVDAPAGSVLRTIAESELDLATAAVELGNVLRPTVAVAWLGTFAVLALDQVPVDRDRLRRTDAVADRYAFAEEVRRTTPFVPALAGRFRRAGSHEGVDHAVGDAVVLDVQGINRDAALHPDPEVFRPDRFLHQQPGPYDLVPQGGGPPEGHRCPGESLTLQLLAATVQVFADRDVTVLSDPRCDLSRIPTLPAEGLRVRV